MAPDPLPDHPLCHHQARKTKTLLSNRFSASFNFVPPSVPLSILEPCAHSRKTRARSSLQSWPTISCVPLHSSLGTQPTIHNRAKTWSISLTDKMNPTAFVSKRTVYSTSPSPPCVWLSPSHDQTSSASERASANSPRAASSSSTSQLWTILRSMPSIRCVHLVYLHISTHS